MKALLVQARTPPTYWSFHYSLPFIRKQAILPPLGLATLAALLPRSWELRIADMHLRPLRQDELRWADVVMVSGMLAQEASIHEALAQAAALGKPTVVGGPAATTAPEQFPEATYLFQGEAEGRLDLLVEVLESGAPGPRVLSPGGESRPDVTRSPVPRFDLTDLRRYASAAIQVSRGCPFTCEFCDIIEVFGRVPRVKTGDQVIAELEALWRLGVRGSLFLVDDNFIGNRRAVGALLPKMAQWQRAHRMPFDLYTEASVDLAGDEGLIASMVEAGFSAVFLGLETPSAAALAEAGKKQNLRMDPATAVEKLTRAGLEVYGGFIVGFDSDREEIFELQRSFISALPVPRAMVGLLTALPGTALWRRLEKEGRLRYRSNGDQFSRPNYAPVMDEGVLISGYRRLLASLYTAESYYRRCARFLETCPPDRSRAHQGGLAALLRATWRIGVIGKRRWHFWKLLARSLRQGLPGIPKATTLAILGEHLVRYTEEVVLPRLDASLAAMGRLDLLEPAGE
jgi:radical SAM superfamily enzyme YgiQ (UPF0313 family)